MKAYPQGGRRLSQGAWAAGLWAACAWALATPACVLAETPSFKDHVVVVGADGQSTLMTQSDSEIVVFRRTVDLPATGGFFKRAKVWANQGDLRLTSLRGEGLVFLGNERVGTFPVPGGNAEDVLFQFTEHGYTLHVVKIGDLPPPDESDDGPGSVLDVRITRP